MSITSTWQMLTYTKKMLQPYLAERKRMEGLQTMQKVFNFTIHNCVAVSAMKPGNRTLDIQASDGTGSNKHEASVTCHANGHLPTD